MQPEAELIGQWKLAAIKASWKFGKSGVTESTWSQYESELKNSVAPANVRVTCYGPADGPDRTGLVEVWSKTSTTSWRGQVTLGDGECSQGL